MHLMLTKKFHGFTAHGMWTLKSSPTCGSFGFGISPVEGTVAKISDKIITSV